MKALDSDCLASLALAAVLMIALIAGGASQGDGDRVVELASMPVIVLGCWRWRHGAPPARWFLLIPAAAIVWGVLQLVPMPSSMFSALPMRAEVLADLRLAGVSVSWHPAALDFWAATRGLIALTIFAAFVHLLCTLTHEARWQLIRIVVVAGVAMAALGYAQAAAGRYSSLRFHEFHHPIGAIGTFANRNHFACLMGMLVPLAIALAIDAQRASRRAEAALTYVAAAILVLASALSFSRSGFLLTCLSAVASLLLIGMQRRKELIAGALLVVVSAAAISIYAWSGISARLQQDPMEDLRWQYLRNGWEVAKAYFPWGSGPGTFRYVYAPFEPTSQMREVFALHAHNDILEIVVESGLFGMVLVIVAIGSLLYVARNKLIVAEDRSPILIGSVVAVTVPMLHSLVDYPLRTYAVAATLALALSVVLSGSGRGVGKAT